MSSPAKNGTAPREHVAPLAFLHAHKSPHRRGSINTATTHRRSAAEFDLLLNLAQGIEARMRQQGPVQIAVEDLEPRQIVSAVTIAFQNFSDWAETAHQADPLTARLRLLREARSTHRGRLRQSLEKLAEQTVDRPLVQSRDALMLAAETAPYAFDAALRELRETLLGLNYPQTTGEAFNRLAHLVQGYHAFSRETAGLPASARRIAELIAQRASAEAEQALAEIALDYAVAALQSAAQRLLEQAKEQAERAARFRCQLDQFVREVAQRRSGVQEQKASAIGSIIVELDSDDDSAMLAALMRRFDATDSAALFEALVERLADNLRMLSAHKYPLLPNRATFAELLCGIASADVADELARLVQHNLGAGQSVYASLRKFGIALGARELYLRAEVLCDLGARDHQALTVTPAEHVLVRLPRCMGEDVQTREALKAAFENLDRGVMFIDSDPDAEVVVVRTLLGFPAAIDATNDILLAAYSECAGIHHAPHLFGVLPNSQAGQPIAEAVNLGQKLQQTERS